MSTTRTSARALALIAGAALALSACATSSSGGDTGASSATTSPVTVTWAYEQEFSGYNANTADQNASANQVVLNQVLPGFWQYDPEGKILPNTDFGTYEKTSDSPLTVKYTINPKAVWSDGKPIGCDDVTLTWLANSGLTGEKGFSQVSTSGYQDMNKPDCKDGDQAFTIVYKKQFADWAAMFGSASILPAHIVEAQAGMTKKIMDFADTPTSADLTKAIEFYNKGWDANPGQLKPEIMLSSGPYKLDSWASGQSMTLKTNDKWWGTVPKAGTIVLRYLAPNSMAQALQNGEANIMKPQPQVDIVNQLKALGDKVKVTNASEYTYEHLDFAVNGAFKDLRLRQAFAKCVPRQQIVDNLVKPTQSTAEILQSRYQFPFQAAYQDFAAGGGGAQYDKVDIAGAKALLAAAGKPSMTVRIGWRKDPAQLNKRRADTIALIQASCAQAGMKVVDAGTPTFFEKEWPAVNWDVAMFAWAGSPLATGSDGTFTKGGGNNPQGYTNPEIEKLEPQLDAEIDVDKQIAIQKQIDVLLWKDLATLPLFAFPGIMATTPNVEGVTYNATQADITWDAYNWNIKQ